MFEWLKRKPREEKLHPELETQVTTFAKKYIEDYMDQVQSLNIGDVLALPNFLSDKSLGSKELPLAVCVKEAYLRNSTVLACVNDISKAVAQAPPTLHKDNDQGNYETIFAHPVLNLLNNPNNTQTREEFIQMIMMHVLLSGNSLVWKNVDKTKKSKLKGKKDKGPIFELIIIDPDMVEYKHNEYEITRYVGKKGTKWSGKSWDPSEIIHFRLVNPLNAFWGISPIQAAYRAIDIDSKIIDWWLNSLENGCKKDAILKFGHDLTGGQFQRVRNLIDQQLAGFRNGRGWMILGHEVDIEFLNMTPAELDFTASRETSAKEIMRIFAVPPPILGDMDQSTYNNMEEATKAFWLFTVVTHLNNISAVLTKRLLPDYGLDVDDYYFGYNSMAVEPLRKLYYDAIDNVVKLVGIGMPLNDAARKLNLQINDIEGGDEGYISHNLVPLGYYNEQMAKTPVKE